LLGLIQGPCPRPAFIAKRILVEDKILKELEHRKLGWKVLFLKYDLGTSLSKEMWCEMADTKKMFDYIF